MTNSISEIIQIECPVCFHEDFPSPQLVYTSCCFQRVCSICDQKLKECAQCRTPLGEIRIRFGSSSFDTTNFSLLRLLPGNQTVSSVIQTVKKFFPHVETYLTSPLTVRLLSPRGYWGSYYEGEITTKDQYYLDNMRLPHYPLTDLEIESWIVSLLLLSESLTKEEIHMKCSSYAARISPNVLSQEQIKLRIKNLMEKKYCEFDKETNTYKYIP